MNAARRAAPELGRGRVGPRPCSRSGAERVGRLSLLRLRAGGGGDGTPDPDNQSRSEEELESMEARLGIGRKGREAMKAQPAATREPSLRERRQIPQDKVEWKEGSLTPEGWDDMDIGEKVTQGLYGERGFLYWLNYLSYRLIFVMIGGWIVFRFVGPAIGIYQLTNPFDFSNVPL